MADQNDIGLGLALALIDSSDAPLLLLDGSLVVIAASASFCRAFEIEEVAGRSFFDLGRGWDSRSLRSLLGQTVAGAAEVESYEFDLQSPGRVRNLSLRAHRIVYDENQVRLLVTVLDQTHLREAEKLKDNELREKGILLQEVQHRVANSLQIIASVLMQSARKVQSEETRSHLRMAHDRVMSVAEVQRQLAVSSLNEVKVRPYLTGLCASIAASMLDPDQISLRVDSEDAVVAPEVSISLGLIATELVINSLKHAYPDGRVGEIVVSYRNGGSWAIEVSDDGAGMPKTPGKPGLGTSIVEALANQLGATVKVNSSHKGTSTRVAKRANGGLTVHERPKAPRVAA